MSEPIAVVVVTYSPGEALTAFLDSLEQATSEHLDVVLADNGSTDGSIELALQRPGIRLVESGENLGYGRAANAGIHQTTAEFVVIANPDVIWEPGSLDRLLSAARRWSKGAAFGPRIHTQSGTIYPSARAIPSLSHGIGHAVFGWWWPSNRWTAAYRVEGDRPAERTAGWLSGACLLLRRDAFDSIGGFDASYFMYFEDLDLGDRLGKAGWQNVYVPSAVVTHTGGHATSRDRRRMAVEHHRSAWLYLSRKYSGLRWLPVRMALRAGLLMRSMLAKRVTSVAEGAEPQQHQEGT
jgi:N-acetylglucosaminyl-diphospho-decaprenol L-rhamnosyltransferase